MHSISILSCLLKNIAHQVFSVPRISKLSLSQKLIMTNCNIIKQADTSLLLKEIPPLIQFPPPTIALPFSFPYNRIF